MGKQTGQFGKVALGTDKVVGMGNWSMDGVTVDDIESTEFGDKYKTFEQGAIDGGSFKFNGHHDPDDTAGQEVLAQALLNKTKITNLRLHLSENEWYEPNQTAGYFSPDLTTGAGTPVSWVTIKSHNVAVDRSGMIAVDFGGKVSGVMVRVKEAA